tara:strand:+ start:2506 stop:3777 length:1272 start_codon:yes stop_codon:yes gene_type:complete
MADIIPAIRGKFGNWEYFQVTMKAGEIATKLTLPKDVPGFENQALEDKYQRVLNDNRASGVMAKYLQDNPHRFFGSIIVTVLEHDEMQFTSISKNLNGLGAAYNKQTSNVGFLDMSGKEIFVPIDGQHRFASIRAAITGKNMSNNEVKGLKSMASLSDDDVSLVLIRHDERNTRQIFNKINRYAKSVSKADNIFTSDDDGVAVVTRYMVDFDELELMNSRMVRLQNTLNAKHVEFTTVSTLYDSNIDILNSNGIEVKSSDIASADDIEQYRSLINEVWYELFNKVTVWKTALKDQMGEKDGDEVRQELREVTVIMKPFGQRVLLKAFLMMTGGNNPYKDRRSGKIMRSDEVIKRINQIDWSLKNPVFIGVVTKTDSRIESGKDNMILGAKLICHMCGTNVNDPEFRQKYKAKSGGKNLPKQLD